MKQSGMVRCNHGCLWHSAEADDAARGQGAPGPVRAAS